MQVNSVVETQKCYMSVVMWLFKVYQYLLIDKSSSKTIKLI